MDDEIGRSLRTLRQLKGWTLEELSSRCSLSIGSVSQQKRSGVGIYHHLSYSYAGKGHTKYVRPEDVPEARLEIENYRTFRDLTRKWVELEIELTKLRRDGDKSNKRDTGRE